MDEPTEDHGEQDEEAGGNPYLSLERDGPASADDRESSLNTGECSALDVDHMLHARSLQFLTGFLPAASAAAWACPRAW